MLDTCPVSLHAQTTTKVTLKVIDETKGALIPDNDEIFGWVAKWSPDYEEMNNTGSWYSNFYNGFTGGKFEKTAEAWTWPYTFDALQTVRKLRLCIFIQTDIFRR